MDATLLWIILGVLHVLLGFIGIVLISANRNPASAIAWLLAIIFIPLLGFIAYLFIGLSKLPRARLEKQREIDAIAKERSVGKDLVSDRKEWPSWLPSAVTLNQNLGALPMVGGNMATLLPEYEASFAAMAADVDNATETVYVEFFILVHDETTAPLFDSMARASARGVKVKVLSDWLMGRMYPRQKETQQILAEMGAEWHPMLPVRPFSGAWQRPDMRNHRKLFLVDGRIGFMGSQNLIDSSYLKPGNIKRGLHWHELMVRIEGPVVREMQAVFLADWYSETDTILPLNDSPIVTPLRSSGGPPIFDAQVLPSGPSFGNDNNLKLYVLMIQNAQRRVSITSPYFVPEESTLLAILTAAHRGVDVELFVSEVGDQALVYHAQRSYYEVLLRAGVKIWLYRSPTVLHAKHFTIDNDLTVIGSSNMDIRSFRLNMEVSVMIHGTELVSQMRAVQDSYRENSKPVDLEEWLARPAPQVIRDNLARLTSSLQ
jgi:cardiolipin synthase